MQEEKQYNHFNWRDLRYVPVLGWAVVFIIWLIEKYQHKKPTDVPINFIKIEDKPKHSPQTKQTNPKYIVAKPKSTRKLNIKINHENSNTTLNSTLKNVSTNKNNKTTTPKNINNKQVSNNLKNTNNQSAETNPEKQNKDLNKEKQSSTTKTETLSLPNSITETTKNNNTNNTQDDNTQKSESIKQNDDEQKIEQPANKEEKQEDNSKTTTTNNNKPKNPNVDTEKIAKIEDSIKEQQIPEFSKRKNLPYLYCDQKNCGEYLSAITLLYNTQNTYEYIMQENQSDPLLNQIKTLFLILNSKKLTVEEMYDYLKYMIDEHPQLVAKAKISIKELCQFLFKQANAKFDPKTIFVCKKMNKKITVSKFDLDIPTKKAEKLLKKDCFLIQIKQPGSKKNKILPTTKIITLMRDVEDKNTWIINMQSNEAKHQQIYIHESCLKYFLIYKDANFAEYLLDFFHTNDNDTYEYSAPNHDYPNTKTMLTMYKNIQDCRESKGVYRIPSKKNKAKYKIQNIAVKTNLSYNAKQLK